MGRGLPAAFYRAMHHVALKLRFTATGIEGTVYCGPAGDSGSNENDVTCTQGTVIDSFIIGAGSTADIIPPAAVNDLR